MFTKRNAYEVIEKVFNGGEIEFKDEVLEIVAKEIAALDHKNAKAKERAAEKREQNDAIREVIANMLTEEPMVIADILNTLNANEAEKVFTPSMVVARMTQLVKAGKAEKVQVKAGDRKLVGYIKA